MSYNGITQCICKNGHWTEIDYWDGANQKLIVCVECGSLVVWKNQ